MMSATRIVTKTESGNSTTAPSAGSLLRTSHRAGLSFAWSGAVQRLARQVHHLAQAIVATCLR
jgi:hypothetical protein